MLILPAVIAYDQVVIVKDADDTVYNALLFTIKVLAYLARYQEMKRERKRKEEKMAAQK